MRSRAATLVEAPRPGELFTAIVTEERPPGPGVLYPGPFYEEMHPGFELVLLLGGRQQRYTDRHMGVLVPGEVTLVQAWEPHSWRPMTDNTAALVIYFMPGFLGEVRFDEVHWLSLFGAAPERRPRAVRGDVRRRLLALGQEMRGSAPSRAVRGEPGAAIAVHYIGEPPAGRPPAWEAAICLWLTQILLLLYQGWEHQHEVVRGQQVGTGDLAGILPALRLGVSEDGGMRRVSLEEAASACRLGVRQFRDLFRRTMGISFGRFELRRRVAQAAQLLVVTDESVQEVAEHCGFTDRSHLHRMFVQRYGKTPAAFREDGGIGVGADIR